jgi:hypothetical protein
MAAAETTAWPVAAAASLAASTMSQHWLLLGVPPAVWFACAAGAIWGATWFEAHRPVARPIAIVANFGAGLVLSTGLDEYANLGTWAHATAGFVAAAWPVMIAQAVRDSVIGAIHKIVGREGGKQ